MEETEILEEVIGDLVDRGYSLNFETLQQAKLDLKGNIRGLPAHEFIIDEIHCCYDNSPDIIYVFAISSFRYKFRAIVINGIVTNTTISAGEVLKKFKTAFLNLFKH